MRRVLVAALVGFWVASAPGGPTPEDWFEFVTIGDPGNPGYDRPVENPFIEGRGAVDYEYRIAVREVSTWQYMTFLNTFTTQSDELADLFREPTHWGAERDFSYAGPGDRYRLRADMASPGELPALGVSWREAARFVNWLNNGMSSDPSAIMDGAYDTSTFVQNGPPFNDFQDQDTHHPWARYWIPTLDEWLKAAHYDSDKLDGGHGGWWIYNDGSDTEPVPGPPGEGETSARWLVDGSGRPAWETPLGSYPQTRSPWGVVDITGGGAEWLEDWSPSCCGHHDRHYDGGAAGSLSMLDHAEYVGGANPNSHGLNTLRVAAAISPCVADFAEPFGVLDVSDALSFLGAFSLGSLGADLDIPAGVLDFSDVYAFLQAFAAGCP
ncbi:MAG: SUMF1/EgtB/PvdO family nonheme iron enzyme [Phycisphaerales bacterium]